MHRRRQQKAAIVYLRRGARCVQLGIYALYVYTVYTVCACTCITGDPHLHHVHHRTALFDDFRPPLVHTLSVSVCVCVPQHM